MDEALPGPAPEDGVSLVKVKEEDPAWEQMCSSQESSSHTLELRRLLFRQFCYQEVTRPREALAKLRELCHQWLRPETHTKEQILELLVLEQFLTILPKELQARVQAYPLESGEDAVTVLENLEKDTGDSEQQASVYTQGQDMHLLVTEYQGASLECQSPLLLPGVTTLKCEPPELTQEVSGPAHQGPALLQEENPRDQAAVPELNSARSQTSVKTEEEAAQALVPGEWPHLNLAQRNLHGNSAREKVTNLSLMTEEVVTKDGLFNPKQETSEEMEPGAEASGIANRDCTPQAPCGISVPVERTVVRLNTLKDRHPGDLWARMHVSSLEYAAGDITRKGRKKDKARVSELLQGLAFSGDSDVEEDNEPETQPASKRLKVSSVPEKNWTKRDIKPNFPSWSALDSGLLNLKSEKLNPVELFELFFDDETFNLIVSETNNYASQKNVNLEVTVQEIRCVFGVLLLSGLVRRPQRGMYWEMSDVDQNLVKDAIRRDRFELIFSYLHFADNNELDESDRFAKVRPLIVRMNYNFQKHAPLEEFYSFGESMCEYFGHRGSKQLPAGKPMRLGYKIWCGTTSRGYLVWFEPSQGTLFTKPDRGLDLGGSMVVKFVDALQTRGCLPYHIFFDKVFTSVKLMSILRKKGVKATGTVREYRTERCPLKDPKELKKMKRGSFDYKVDESEEIIVCRWHDSSVVNICSNAVGIEPVGLTSPPSGVTKTQTQVHQPSLLRLYQEKVGGVSRMDQNIAKYKVKIRGMKWYSSFIGYVIDAALNNAWQLHRICCHDAQVDLLAFRRYVACVYLESNADTSSQGRRSRRLETESRFDMIGHWIIHQDKRTRCALCHSQTNTRCEKCQKGVHAKCFRAYHIR